MLIELPIKLRVLQQSKSFACWKTENEKLKSVEIYLLRGFANRIVLLILS